jgi:DNA topoisomerase-3
LKSCELTGIWEKKLRDIEHQRYDSAKFIEELKQLISQIVKDVLADHTHRVVSVSLQNDNKKKSTPRSSSHARKKASSRSSKKSSAMMSSSSYRKRS